ncbi:sec1 family domain-containing protein 2-like isoform X2 [Dermacentor andersoni]|uniref:sec1 family domain-containing protein 2-like isoform X2 n=1 Tax=Dermacentor andersoni TaxID=34620 RepID=UPI002416AFC5|nr:sec1 family domain-containing protein 2-like isoform X2 [Dermacentor andersoni]
MHQNVSPLEAPVKQLWEEEVFPRCQGAVVFLDDAMAEALHWNGGANKLFDAGALAVREFSFFEHGSESEPKALFLVSTPVTEQTLATLSAVVRASVFSNVSVLTSCPPAAQLLARYGTTEGLDGPRAFLDIEERLLDWMGNVSTSQAGTTLEGAGFSRSMQISLKSLIGNLNSIFEVAHIREETFSLGSLSRIVGEELSRLSRGHRKSAESKVSLLLLDRTLDMAGSLTASCESLMDILVRVLPPLPGHSLDVCVDMRCISCSSEQTMPSEGAIYPGCLAHENSKLALQHIVNCKQKECMMELNRLIVEAALKQGVRLDVTGRLTAEQLRKRIIQFRKDGGDAVIDMGLVQQILGVAQAALGERYSKLEDLLSTEKVIVQNVSVSTEAASRSLVQLLRSRNTTGLQLEDIMALMALLYSLFGEKTLGIGSDKRTLKAEIVAAVYQAAAEKNLPEFFKHFVSDEQETLDENTVIQKVDEIFRAVEALRMARHQLRKYRTILEEGNLMQPAVYKPLLKQLLQDIFDPNMSEALQLNYHSGGLSDMLKAGFGLFRSTSKPLPKDSPVLIVFIIGGVTASEVKLVNDITSSRKLPQEVIVGSTTLAKPHQQLGLLVRHST